LCRRTLRESIPLKSLPQTNDTLLIRTDFSDQTAWQALHTAITTPNEDDFLANVHIVDDPAYSELTTEQVISLAPARGFLLIVADKTALTTPEMPLLAVLPFEPSAPVGLSAAVSGSMLRTAAEDDHETEQDHGELRVIAEELWSIENNLSLANMDWEDFVGAADDDGVFRGF